MPLPHLHNSETRRAGNGARGGRWQGNVTRRYRGGLACGCRFVVSFRVPPGFANSGYAEASIPSSAFGRAFH